MRPPDLDTALLCSSLPDGTELCHANAVLRNELARPGELSSTTKRYIERMTRALGMAQSGNSTLRKELKAQEELLHTCQNPRKGKWVTLKGKFVLSTDEVLKIAREAEPDSAKKKRRQRQLSRSASVRVSDDELGTLKRTFSVLDSDFFVVAASIMV
jgi:hypothetical protein